MKPESLRRCQVATPEPIVDFMWALAHKRRERFESVGDFGAGDGRFARSGRYDRYVGYEIDKQRIKISPPLPTRASIVGSDAFSSFAPEFNLVLGNPPYVKGAELDQVWKEQICRELDKRAGVRVARNANLFVYFLFLALLRTKPDGLAVLLVPYEWVSRPSTRALRQFIEDQGWSVDVYRFGQEIFDRVLTTACISIIDKSTSSTEWRYFALDERLRAASQKMPGGSRSKVLDYSRREEGNYCLRGLSPGGQDIFVLTEHERVLNGLRLDVDVYPAVTTLRDLPASMPSLTRRRFNDHFVATGAKCWLIRSDVEKPTQRVRDYLESVPAAQWQQYSTCTTRPVWWRYKNHPAAPILLASGFRARGPKVVANEVSAIACGSVYAVFSESKKLVPKLRQSLSDFDFGTRVVGHANGLRKLEVNQVNAALARILISA